MSKILEKRVNNLEQIFNVTNKKLTLEERITAIENISVSEMDGKDTTIGEMALKTEEK